MVLFIRFCNLVIVGLLALPALARLPEPQLQRCWIEGLGQPVRCGSLEVLENRSDAKSRKLSIYFAVVPAASTTAAPEPLFVLAGGPGQAATALAPWVNTAFRKIHARRDIVLVDLRGTGKSHPLKCKSLGDGFPAASSGPSLAAIAQSCLAQLDADPRFYSSFDAMEDLDEVRRMLGYDRIDLWGGSYGTRAALMYMRLHPERVRSAILDGVAPFAFTYPLNTAPDSQRALDLLFERCASESHCRASYPDLRREFDEVRTRLARGPVRYKLPHPRTGQLEDAEITLTGFVNGLRGFLYVPEQASLIPWMIHQSNLGDFGPFAALSVELSGWSADTMQLGFTFSVLCSEDVSRMTRPDIARLTANTFVGSRMADEWSAACAVWPRAALPEHYDAPLASNVPVLILSGSADPVSPPRWGQLVASTLPNSLHVVLPGGGHNVSPRGCAPDLMARFLTAGTGRGLDTRCIQSFRPPPFFAPAAALEGIQ